MWESTESLMHLRNWIQIVGVVFAILAAGSGALGHIIGNKISKLNSEESVRLKRELVATVDATTDIKRRMESREISADQRIRMLEVLKAAPGGPVVFWFAHGDSESFAFAEKLNDIVRDASWRWQAVESALFGNKPMEGVTIFVQSIETPPSHARPLQQALKEAGIEVNVYPSDKVSPDMVKVVVGKKP